MEELQERDWRRLIETIHRGNCVLVLGADVAFDPDDVEAAPLCSRLAQRLSEDAVEVPQDTCELPLVAQLYLQKSDVDRYDLEIAVADFYKPYRGGTTALHRHLAALPFSLCITTTPEGFMVQALDEAGKAPQRAHYDFSDPGRQRLLTGADPRHPIVYGLFGDLDEPKSLVLTETELLDFLVSVARGSTGLPDYISAQLAARQTSFLFVGFGFQHWYSRILLHVIQVQGHRGARSLAMEGDAFFAHPERALTALFFEQTCAIAFRRHDWQSFAAELRRRYEAQFGTGPEPAEPPEGAPVVFLCHDSRDWESVAALERRLHALGIDTWRDRQQLRGGDDWDRRIRRVLNKRVDYVLVCETPGMQTKGEAYLHLEIDEALERQRRFPRGARFLIPAMLESCDCAPDLEHLHREDLTDDRGLRRFAESLLADWRERSERTA